MKKIFAIITLIWLMIIASYTWSEIVYVNDETGNDETGEGGNPLKPFKTIQAGIDAAIDKEDEVWVADGTYTGDKNTYLQTYEKAITVKSENGPENCIIDCEGNNTKAFSFQHGEGPDTVIRGFTMTGGRRVGNGGAITCYFASPTITENIIINNEATEGGGAILCKDSSPKIINNFIIENSTAKNGGAILCSDSDNTEIIGNTIIGNTATENGGAIMCKSSSLPKIINNIITGNRALKNGGAIVCEDSSPEIINNTITDNEAVGTDSIGGAIVLRRNYSMVIINDIIVDNGDSPTVTSNIITGNSAEDKGGAIYCDHSNPTITNNIIAGNSTGNNGGAIFCTATGADPMITYNTITGNSAVNYGGGIVCANGAFPTVRNSILWNNSPEEIYLNFASITVDYSDVEGGEAGVGGEGTVNWGEGNIDIEPLLDVNYHLTDYSPCIGAGSDTPDITDDIDGDPRPNPELTAPDMGADENNRPTPLPRGDVSGNETVTAFDAALVLQHVVGLINLSEGQQKGADVTGDKIVSALDAALILQYTVGLITKFPAEKGTGAPKNAIVHRSLPFLNAESESKLLADAISTLEKISLDREQEEVIKQLKYFLVGNILPTHTALFQNYPNPFNPETWLPYKLAQDVPVTIRIYNAKGQLVYSLQLGMKQAGSYITKDRAAYWDGRDNLGQKVASGVYFYTLLTGKYTETRRMVILK